MFDEIINIDSKYRINSYFENITNIINNAFLNLCSSRTTDEKKMII